MDDLGASLFFGNTHISYISTGLTGGMDRINRMSQNLGNG